jgi:hydroxymethylpyrimidine pyrophosphatase-like HAD family hydrolase
VQHIQFINKTVLVDIDGCLSNPTHRLHYIQTKPKNWPAFEACLGDDPIFPEVIELVKLYYNSGYRIVIVTARPERCRESTIKWLHEKANLKFYYERLEMRSDDDFRSGDLIKKDKLDKLREEGFNPFLALDDNDDICEMYRANGIKCFQVEKEH